ncbi:hypothetical protein OS493_006751 [Desmophyllum pertusum]|uniref:Uncharacterized protein n=1 Tax=Desmophyllum pertusum TaxID=174260 RepID=A0A9W9ZTF4_9CNID|nr:hypothetical protein OS493_006751 [Desmophyllum pertusum]
MKWDEENLEDKVIMMVKEKLDVDLKQEDIDIVHRVGKMEQNGDAVIVKFSSNKTKMRVVMKRRVLKGTGITIAEDIAPEMSMIYQSSACGILVKHQWSTGQVPVV